MAEHVAIIGASDKPDRYSYKAFQLLKEYGHTPLPVHPRVNQIDGIQTFHDLKSLINTRMKVDTVTMYIRALHSSKLKDDLIALKPRRIIFNPGAENPSLAQALIQAGIEPIEACTLVMLRTGQF